MPHPVLTVAQMRAWEKATWAAGVREDDVMRRAGQAVARCAERLTAPGDLVVVLAGRGHNGDDATYAGEFLRERSRELLRVEDPTAAMPQLAALLARRPALIVDGLFGIGLNRALSPEWAALVEQINAAGRPVLAVDVPSGLDAESGQPRGPAVRAALTLTLGAPKQGLLAADAAAFVGRLEVAADLGLVPCPFTTELGANCAEDFHCFPPARPVAAHKGTFGHLAIIAGSRGYHGAAVLAARAAQRAQPGLITLLVPEEIYPPVAAQLQAVMVRLYVEAPELPEGVTAVLAGPGLASKDLPSGTRDLIGKLWSESPAAVVTDASALDWLPAGMTPALRIITPHPGEAARLLSSTTAAVQMDRVEVLRQLSANFGNCRVVLKGHHTLIGSAHGAVTVNLTGNPRLAQGGSGDVLAGYLSGWLAQPHLQASAATVLNLAVWRHGVAADQLFQRRPGFTIEELVDELGL